MIKAKESAYLTIYLSLVFGIVLSLLLVCIEGATIGAVRAQAEIVADLGLDSVFAEFNREILNQYELFFIDSSYGGKNGGVGMVEAHLSDYMGHNMNPGADLPFIGAETLLNLKNPYLEITDASYASDNNCMVWKAQAINYMKAVYGGDLVSAVKDHMDTVSSNRLMTRDVAGEIAQQKEAFEEALAEADIVEFDEESEEGYSYQKVSDLFDSFIGGGLLSLVMPKDKAISKSVMDNGHYFSSRMKNKKINKGTGLHDGVDKPDSMIDELIYNEYLMKMCGSYSAPKNEGMLQYQIEYILYGKNSDAANLRACAERLYAVRAAANLAAINNDSVRQTEAELVAAVICSVLLVPELADVLSTILLGIWALAEAAVDVYHLLEGGKVPLIKSSNEWQTSISGLFSGSLFGSGKSTKGLSYQDYLRVFLGMMNRNNKAARSLDIVEMDIRQTAGNSGFRIDRCIDYIKVNFGFEDANGHDFVFSRKMCYCS